jgi:hypothetical protein
MVFKTNYNQQRMERDRAKKAKKEEKLRERQEEAARRKAAGLPPESDPADEAPASLEGNT